MQLLQSDSGVCTEYLPSVLTGYPQWPPAQCVFRLFTAIWPGNHRLPSEEVTLVTAPRPINSLISTTHNESLIHNYIARICLSRGGCCWKLRGIDWPIARVETDGDPRFPPRARCPSHPRLPLTRGQCGCFSMDAAKVNSLSCPYSVQNYSISALFVVC